MNNSSFLHCMDLNKVCENLNELAIPACPLCDSNTFKHNDQLLLHFKKIHVKHAITWNTSQRSGFTLPCCKTTCVQKSSSSSTKKSGHYHCNACDSFLVNKFSFKRHLSGKCSSKIFHFESHKDYKCPVCSKSFSDQQLLVAHKCTNSINQLGNLPAACVDANNGIFLVAFRKTGLLAPVHVQSHSRRQKQVCDNDKCHFDMTNPNLRNPSVFCCHLLAAPSAVMSKQVTLTKDSLQKLLSLNVINLDTFELCWKKNLECISNCIPLVVEGNFASFGCEERTRYFSVYTGTEEYYSRLQRVRVTLDSYTGRWSCRCPYFRKPSTCHHESMAKWLFIETDKKFDINSHNFKNI